MPPRAHVLLEATLSQWADRKPQVAVLPWGATEAHNLHLPHGTDVLEAQAIAQAAAGRAVEAGARIVVLPAIPFGNDEQQLDQVATVSFTTSTALAILDDVVRSLLRQGIDRLVLLNGHGGNHFQPMVRDLQGRYDCLIVVVDFFRLLPELKKQIFEKPGDHADEMETSLLLHLHPDWVQMETAGKGEERPFALQSLRQPGVWTPRPWSACCPDTGSGDPSLASAEKGKKYFDALTICVGDMLVELASARRGQIPYVQRDPA